MINPVIRQRVAYAVGGSLTPFWDPSVRAGIWELPGTGYATLLVYHKTEFPPYTPLATQQWPLKTRSQWAYGVPSYRDLWVYGTMATTFVNVIYFSYALHIADYTAGPLDSLAAFPLIQSTYFPVRRNYTGTENVFVNSTISVKDHGSIFDSDECAKIIIGGWSGDSEDFGGAGPGGYDWDRIDTFKIHDDIDGTSFTATNSSRSFSGTTATLIFRALTRRSFNVNRMSGSWRSNGGAHIGRFFEIDQDRDPLWYASGNQTGQWYNIGSADQFLATIFISFVEGSSNINGLNPAT